MRGGRRALSDQEHGEHVKAVVALFFQPVVLQISLASYGQDLIADLGPIPAWSRNRLPSAQLRNLGKTDRGIQRCGHSPRKHASYRR